LLTKKSYLVISVMSFFVILSAPLLFLRTPIEKCSAQEEYTYFGAIPYKMWWYVLNDTSRPEYGYIYKEDVDTRRSRVLLSVTATENGTQTSVYNLSDNSLVAQTTLDAMQKLFVLFPNGTMFKVVTDKYASVMLLSFPDIPPNSVPNVRDPIPQTYHAGVDGAYVGKEFIFMASWNPGSGPAESYRIFALERADVTITDENGDERSYTIQTNSYRDVGLETYVSYRVESTGNIMIQSMENQGRGAGRIYYFVPSAEGGFVGRVFFTTSTTDWDSVEDYGFRISATEDSEVAVWDLELRAKILDVTVQGGAGTCIQPKATVIMIQSTEPITVEWLANGSTTRQTGGDAYGSGIAYIGVKPNEETQILLPTNSTNEAYIFAYTQTTVTLDSEVITVDAGSYYLFTMPGVHTVVSDQNVVIEVISWPLYPDIQGLYFDGVEIPCAQLTDVVPDVTLTPMEESPLMTYAIIAVAVVAAAAGSGYFVMRRRKK